MDHFQKGFKEDFFDTIFKVTRKTWWPITLAHAIYTIITTGCIALLGLGAFSDGLQDLFSDPQIFSDPDALKNLIDSGALMDILPENFAMLATFLLIVFLLAVSWNYNFAFIVTDNQVKNKMANFKTTLMSSFNSGILKIITVSLLLYIAFFLSILIATNAAKFSGLLGSVLFTGAFIFMLRFTLVLPAYLIGNQSLESSFAYSFYHMTWVRALKMGGIVMSTLFAFLIIGIIMMMISLVIMLIPIVGPLLWIAANTLFGGLLMALSVAAMVGLYYRYVEELTINNDEEGDLLATNDVDNIS